ncbi:MAG: DedA family protein [Proteobacteria bacterium]|nr:DedA family protein [Pseudomonadota bacterium]
MPDLMVLTQHFPYAGLFILLILGGLGLPFPEDATLMLCGFLLFHGIVKPVPALLIVYVGLLLADVMVYWFGRAYGDTITGHRWFQKLISPQRLEELKERFRKRGLVFILIGRHIIGIRLQLFLAAGVIKMPLPRFILADGLSSTMTIALMTGIGYMGGSSLEAIGRNVARIEHYLALALIAGLLVYFILKKRAIRNAGRKSG